MLSNIILIFSDIWKLFNCLAHILRGSGTRFTKIRKSYEFIPPIVYGLNEFVERKTFVRTFVKRTAGVSRLGVYYIVIVNGIPKMKVLTT